MKYLIPLLFLVSCAAQPRHYVFPEPPSPPKPPESLRYAEVIRPYHVGRYVDPNHPDTMQDQHTVYRLESSARWNLGLATQTHGLAVRGNMMTPTIDAAYMPTPTNDAVIAELNHQRELTRQVIHEAARLTQSYQELQTALAGLKTMASNTATMGARLSVTEQKVAEFAKEIQKLNSPPPPITNDVSSIVAAPQGAAP